MYKAILHQIAKNHKRLQTWQLNQAKSFRPLHKEEIDSNSVARRTHKQTAWGIKVFLGKKL